MTRKRTAAPLAALFSFSFLVIMFASTPSFHARPVASDLDLPFDNCTVIMAGKDATPDGSVITTHTADCGSCDWTWRKVPAADHKAGEMRKLYHISQMKTWPPKEGLKWDMIKKDFTGVEIPEPPHTYGYMHGVFGYMNDQQLAIGESTIGNQRKLSNPTPAAKTDITMLTLLAMERAKTAREAIALMGSLAEKYGYGFVDGGEMLAVADAKEVWVFEIMPAGPLWTPESGKPGAVWCAQRVPDDQVSVCPNESRIGEIDPAKPDLFMASSNAVSLAVEMGFYDPKSGKPFNWKRAYSPGDGSAASSQGRRARLWRFFDVVAPSQKFKPETPNMDLPFSVKPDKKISVQDVMALTRDKCEGTIFDPVRGIRGGPFANPNYYAGTRTIGTNKAEYTTVTQCRSGLPDSVAGIIWLAWGAQDTSCYMPFYAGVTTIPKSFNVGDHWEFNRGSARWAFDYADFHAQVAYAEAIQDIKKAQQEWEVGALTKITEIDKQAAELYAKSPAKAAQLLTNFCTENANKVVAAWWDLGDKMLVKYNHFGYYDAEKRGRSRGKPAPEMWRKAVRMTDVLTEPDTQR
ncbi:MAG: C69 family dipeptidase [Candidatus Aminicenantes bacterium]|nr:C69 family dipeptidase [Candidatus Aminicenantes bacterium]